MIRMQMTDKSVRCHLLRDQSYSEENHLFVTLIQNDIFPEATIIDIKSPLSLKVLI